MGNGSGIMIPEKNGRIFKVIDCGCICSLVYKEYCTENIELLCSCYNCLNNLKKNQYNPEKISKLFKNYVGKNIMELTNKDNINNWLFENEAIIYAQSKKIPYEELVPDDEFEYLNPCCPKKDLLKRYKIDY